MSTFIQLRAPLPERIETPRLLLRCWRPEDAAWLKDAIDSSLLKLQAWMAWATNEPSPIEMLAERLKGFRHDFRAGCDWAYGVFDRAETRVVGGAGLHPRGAAGVLEIGYWVRTDATQQGHATEAAATLTAVAFEFAAIDRVEIRCDPRNLRSATIPRRLGYRHTATLRADARTPAGAPRDTMVWTLTPAQHATVAARRWMDA